MSATWDQLDEGAAAPRREYGPLTRTDFVRYQGASGDFNPIHHDEEFAKSAGFPTVFSVGMLQAGILGCYCTDWLGAENVRPRKPVMGAEDFGRFSDGKVPIFMYFLGTITKDKYEAAQKPGAAPLPGMHTDAYAPVPEPSIRTGVPRPSAAIAMRRPQFR